MNVLIWNFLAFPVYHLLYVIQYLDVLPNIGLDEGIFNESGTLFLANCADDQQVFNATSNSFNIKALSGFINLSLSWIMAKNPKLPFLLEILFHCRC